MYYYPATFVPHPLHPGRYIDAIAEDMGFSRSGVINVAARDYINRMG
jgi:hypothetical protein